MPTTGYPFATNEMSLRFKEVNLSEAINRKNSLIIPRGIHKGFTLSQNLSVNMTVNVNGYVDPITGAQQESAAVIQIQSQSGVTNFPSNDLSLTLRTFTTPIPISLSNYTGQTVVIGLYGYYIANSSTGPSTTAEIRTYTLAEYAVLSQQDSQTFVPMGTVLVPGSSSIIPAVNITPLHRMEAWENAGSGSLSWSKIIRNGGFEGQRVTASGYMYEIPYWELSLPVGVAKWVRVNATDTSDGPTTTALIGGNSLGVYSAGPGAVTFSGTAGQKVNAPVTAGQNIRVRFNQQVYVSDSSGIGTAAVVLGFYKDSSGSPVTATISVPGTTTQGTDTTIDQIIQVPTTITSGTLAYVNIVISGYVIPAGSAALVTSFDEVGVWLDNQSVFEQDRNLDVGAHAVWANPLILDTDAGAPSGTGNRPLISYDPTYLTTGAVVIDRVDQTNNPVPTLYTKGDTHVHGNLTVEGTTTITSGTITASTLTATGTVQGAFIYSTGALQADGNLTVNGPTATVVDLEAQTINVSSSLVTQQLSVTTNANIDGGITVGYGTSTPIMVTAATSNYPAVPTLNTIYTNNIVKAWGRIKSNSTSSPTIISGFNIASVSVSGGQLVVVFPTATAMTTTTYNVVGSAEDELGHYSIFCPGPVMYQLTTGFNVSVFGASSGSPPIGIDLSTTNQIVVNFVVYGS